MPFWRFRGTSGALEVVHLHALVDLLLCSSRLCRCRGRRSFREQLLAVEHVVQMPHPVWSDAAFGSALLCVKLRREVHPEVGTLLHWGSLRVLATDTVPQLPQKMGLMADGFTIVALICAGAIDEVVPNGFI